MQGPAEERLEELREQTAKEKDPAKLKALVQEINRLLDEKYKRPPRTSKKA